MNLIKCQHFSWLWDYQKTETHRLVEMCNRKQLGIIAGGDGFQGPDYKDAGDNDTVQLLKMHVVTI
jgi:hypothetical protein